MDDLASEFTAEFLDAIQVLQDISSSDADLKEVLETIKHRVDAKQYSCAPNFWEDLNEGLLKVEVARSEKNSKSKAQHVLKQVARLEVKFWAKESVGMLKELDPDFRLERMVDWIKTFDASESGDASSGPAVLYQVLNDPMLQKDMDGPQRDALIATVRENISKFPVEMQTMLERMGTLHGKQNSARLFGDFRRRAAPQEAESGAARFIKPLVGAQDKPPEPEMDTPMTPQVNLHAPAATPMQSGETVAEDAGEEDDGSQDGFSLDKMDPQVLERLQRAVLALLEANGGEVSRTLVRNLLKQSGVLGMPIAALGDSVFFSATEIFLRRSGAPTPAPPRVDKSPVPEALLMQMVELVRESEGRIQLNQLMERLTWHPGSIRHNMHGPLRKAVAQTPDLFFEPKKVFSILVAQQHLTVLGQPEEQPAPEVEEQVPEVTGAPYVADPFAELVATVLSWLEQNQGVLQQEVVMPLVKALAFKPRVFIAAIANDVYWAHHEAELQVLLRTVSGTAMHPSPLPENYLHQAVYQNLIRYIKQMGAKAKVDKLAGDLNWNAKSELRKVYGQIRTVLSGLRQIFFDQNKLYLKKALEGVVEWPVTRRGRAGPGGVSSEEPPVRHWTPATDDIKNTTDPTWINVKRQLLGTMMHHGGSIQVEVAQQLLQPVEGLTLAHLEAPITSDGNINPYNLSELILVPKDRVYWRRSEARQAQTDIQEQVVPEVRQVALDTVKAKGSATLLEIRAILDAGEVGVQVDEAQLEAALRLIPELFYAPDLVLLKYVASRIVDSDPEASEAAAATKEAEKAAAVPGSPKLKVTEREADDAFVDLLATAADVDMREGRRDGQEGTEQKEEGQFLSFDSFSADDAPSIERPPAKRSRIDQPVGWTGDDTPPWAAEGCAVTVRDDQGDAAGSMGVIMSVQGSTCGVRLMLGDRNGKRSGGAAGQGLLVERDFSISALLPVAPKEGMKVKVVGGTRAGCYGTLIGLAGSDGVVQIGKLSYETLSMSQLAVIAELG